MQTEKLVHFIWECKIQVGDLFFDKVWYINIFKNSLHTAIPPTYIVIVFHFTGKHLASTPEMGSDLKPTYRQYLFAMAAN